MSEHERYHQGSFEITPDGAFDVPEAPQPDERSDRQRKIEDTAALARQAHEASLAARPYQVRQSDAQADLGGQADQAPKSNARPLQHKGWNSRIGLIDNDGRIRAQIADQQTEERRVAAALRAERDDEDRARTRAGIAQARAANPPIERETWDRTHVLNEGDEVSDAFLQVGNEHLRSVPNQDPEIAHHQSHDRTIRTGREQFIQPPPPEPIQGPERPKHHPINDARRYLSGEEPEEF